MQITLVLSTIGHLVLYSILYCYGLAQVYILVGALLNLAMILKIFIEFGFKYLTQRLCRGEITPFFCYLCWITWFWQPEHLFILPIFMSCIGKTYLLITPTSQTFLDPIQNLILLQSQTEFFITVYTLCKTFFVAMDRPWFAFVEVFSLILIIKWKF